MSILRDEDLKFSSKRVMGILYLLAGLFIVVYKEWIGAGVTNKEMVIGIMVTGGGLLGLSVAKYFKKQ